MGFKPASMTEAVSGGTRSADIVEDFLGTDYEAGSYDIAEDGRSPSTILSGLRAYLAKHAELGVRVKSKNTGKTPKGEPRIFLVRKSTES